jgi:hypothetical protein
MVGAVWFACLVLFVSMSYYVMAFYPKAPEALGGAAPRCAYLDVDTTKISKPLRVDLSYITVRDAAARLTLPEDTEEATIRRWMSSGELPSTVPPYTERFPELIELPDDFLITGDSTSIINRDPENLIIRSEQVGVFYATQDRLMVKRLKTAERPFEIDRDVITSITWC